MPRFPVYLEMKGGLTEAACEPRGSPRLSHRHEWGEGPSSQHPSRDVTGLSAGGLRRPRAGKGPQAELSVDKATCPPSPLCCTSKQGLRHQAHMRPQLNQWDGAPSAMSSNCWSSKESNSNSCSGCSWPPQPAPRGAWVPGRLYG